MGASDYTEILTYIHTHPHTHAYTHWTMYGRVYWSVSVQVCLCLCIVVALYRLPGKPDVMPRLISPAALTRFIWTSECMMSCVSVALCVCFVVEALHSRSFALNISVLFVVHHGYISFRIHVQRRSTVTYTVQTSVISKRSMGLRVIFLNKSASKHSHLIRFL